jgi:hypothetical protein
VPRDYSPKDVGASSAFTSSGVYRVPRPSVFNHASVGMTPFAARVKEAATVITRSHDGDALPPARQLVVDGINRGRLGFTGRSLIRFHCA